MCTLAYELISIDYEGEINEEADKAGNTCRCYEHCRCNDIFCSNRLAAGKRLMGIL